MVQTGKPTFPCTADPFLYAADTILPVVALGEEAKCEIGRPKPTKTEAAAVEQTVFGKHYEIFGTVATVHFAVALYKLICWLALSLAIATWSGVFKRGGRA